jgi:HD-like signal output (HDOD) protein
MPTLGAIDLPVSLTSSHVKFHSQTLKIRAVVPLGASTRIDAGMSEMLDQLKSKLKASVNFPSPPAIAQQIIALAGDPHIDISQVAAAISRDSSLAAKLLRVANSALYSRQRRSTNLRQALIVLGLHGATTLALGFSLVGTYRGLKSNGVNYDRYWRRAILSASAAKCFGALQNASAVDDVFLAALLQDIAILGVDRAAPDFYGDLPRNASHREFPAYETARLGIDHAELGAWLLEYWKLPEPLCRAVAWSHAPSIADRSTPTGMAACVSHSAASAWRYCWDLQLRPILRHWPSMRRNGWASTHRRSPR